MNEIMFYLAHGTPAREGYTDQGFTYWHSQVSKVEVIKKFTMEKLNVGDDVIINGYRTSIVKRIYNADNNSYIFCGKDVYTGKIT